MPFAPSDMQCRRWLLSSGGAGSRGGGHAGQLVPRHAVLPCSRLDTFMHAASVWYIQANGGRVTLSAYTQSPGHTCTPPNDSGTPRCPGSRLLLFSGCVPSALTPGGGRWWRWHAHSRWGWGWGGPVCAVHTYGNPRHKPSLQVHPYALHLPIAILPMSSLSRMQPWTIMPCAMTCATHHRQQVPRQRGAGGGGEGGHAVCGRHRCGAQGVLNRAALLPGAGLGRSDCIVHRQKRCIHSPAPCRPCP